MNRVLREFGIVDRNTERCLEYVLENTVPGLVRKVREIYGSVPLVEIVFEDKLVEILRRCNVYAYDPKALADAIRRKAISICGLKLRLLLDVKI